MSGTAINPATGTEQVKRMWLYLYDDLLFPVRLLHPDSEIQSVVDRAVFRYLNEGEAALNMITPETSVDTDALYPFVLDFETSETVAHGAYPHLVGEVPSASLHEEKRRGPRFRRSCSPTAALGHHTSS